MISLWSAGLFEAWCKSLGSEEENLCTSLLFWNYIFYVRKNTLNNNLLSCFRTTSESLTSITAANGPAEVSRGSPQKAAGRFNPWMKCWLWRSQGEFCHWLPGEKAVSLLFSVGFIWSQHVSSESERISLPAFPVIAYIVLFGECNRWSWLLLAPSNAMCHTDLYECFHLCCSADISCGYTIQRVLESSEVLFLLAVKVPVSEKCIRSEITQI